MDAVFNGTISNVNFGGGETVDKIEIVWIKNGTDNGADLAAKATAAQAAGRFVTWQAPTHNAQITAFQAAGQLVTVGTIDDNVAYTPAVRITKKRVDTTLLTGLWYDGSNVQMGMAAVTGTQATGGLGTAVGSGDAEAAATGTEATGGLGTAIAGIDVEAAATGTEATGGLGTAIAGIDVEAAATGTEATGAGGNAVASAPGIGGIDSYTKLMLHMNGADGSTTFADSSLTPKTVTRYGNAQIDTAEGGFGGASGLFPAAGDYLAVTYAAAWGTGPWTLDTRVQFESYPVYRTLIGQGGVGNNVWMWFSTDGKFYFQFERAGSVQAAYNTTNNLNLGTTRHHLEIGRNGTNIYIFIDGVSQALTETTAVSTNDLGTHSGTFNIGADRDGAGTPIKWQDEFRLSIGTCRHTANFTPPAGEYTE